MTEKKYSRKGSLYKEQSTTNEPRAPEAQDISRSGKSTYYLALHQTIASTLKPLSHFFDNEAGEEESSVTSPEEGLLLHVENFDKIREKIDRCGDSPLRRFLHSQLHNFIQYFLNQSQFLEKPGVKSTGFSQKLQHDFYSPSDAHKFQKLLADLPRGAGISWDDPLTEALFQLFLKILPPGDEKALLEMGGGLGPISAIPFMKHGAFNFIESIAGYPLASPVASALLSDYTEVSESRIDDHTFQYILNPREKNLNNLDVIYDMEKESFSVKGDGYTRTIGKGGAVDPQVLVNPETGWETRIFQYNQERGLSVMEIEVYDTRGMMVMKSLKRNTPDGDREVRELLYETNRLKESLCEVRIGDSLDIERRYLYSYDGKGALKDISEQSKLVLPVIKSIDDLGLRNLREARILEVFCRSHRLQLEIVALWIPADKGVSLQKRRIDLMIPGSLKGYLEEETTAAGEFILQSEILDSNGQIIYRRSSGTDGETRSLSHSMEDRRARNQWEQKLRLAKDGSLQGIQTLAREFHEREMRGGIPPTLKSTHLLPGSIVYSYERFYDALTRKEETHFHHNFDKLVGNQWIKPDELRKTDSGESIVRFRYELSPGCLIEEERHYSGDDFFETSSHIRKRVEAEKLLDEKLIKRSRETEEETIEIVRRKGDSEYSETTAVKQDHTDRFIRSRRISEKVPLDFFTEPNRWINFSTREKQGGKSFVSTYIHERSSSEMRPPERRILIREETYEYETADKREILNFLAFLDDDESIHYRTKATSLKQDVERTIIWEDGELIQQYETAHKAKKKPHESSLGSFGSHKRQ